MTIALSVISLPALARDISTSYSRSKIISLKLSSFVENNCFFSAYPPAFAVTQFKNLQSFLSELRSFRQAKDLRLAVELRHASWYTEEHDTSAMLSTHNACWTATEFPNLPRDIHLTADFLYVRWIGKHGSYQSHERERVDKTAELKLWWQQLQTYLDRVESIYGYFNNDYAGHAPATCNKFKTIAGFEIKHPEIPKQPRLF